MDRELKRKVEIGLCISIIIAIMLFSVWFTFIKGGP